MLDEAQRLERLVADLLDLARLDAHEFRMDLAPVDLAGVVAGAAEVWRHRCAAAGVDVPRRGDRGRRSWSCTDAQRLRQVLDGLLENALRVTPAGRADRAGRHAPSPTAGRGRVVEVRDGGPGLTDDDLAVAFERSVLYERYRGVRQVGTGLGLAIVHRLVDPAGRDGRGRPRARGRRPLHRAVAGRPSNRAVRPSGHTSNTDGAGWAHESAAGWSAAALLVRSGLRGLGGPRRRGRGSGTVGVAADVAARGPGVRPRGGGGTPAPVRDVAPLGQEASTAQSRSAASR